MRNEINVTPLVDVCLVLLIIFMVIGPEMARGKEVVVPETDHHADGKDNKAPVVVVDEEGALYVGNTAVDGVDGMTQAVQKEWSELTAANAHSGDSTADRSGESTVLFKMARGMPYREAYPILVALQKAGATGILLGTVKRESKK